MLQIRWNRETPPLAESVQASIEQLTEDERRGVPRHLTLLRVALLHVGSTRDLCIVRNLSARGVSASVYRRLDVGETVQIEFRSDEHLPGEVVWTKGQEVGIAFPTDINVEAVLASRWVSENGKQQRLPRIELECGCRVRVGSNFYLGKLRDISQGGAKIDVQRPFQGSGDATLTLPEVGTVDCTIRWSSKTTVGLCFNERLPFVVLAQWLQAQRAKQMEEPALESALARTESPSTISADNRANGENTQGQHFFRHFNETIVAGELSALAARHEQQVAELVFKLRQEGIDDQLVQQSVERLTAAHEAQLVHAIRAVGR